LTVALVLAPDDPSLLNLLGIAFFHTGHLVDAWRCLAKAHQLLPDNAAIERNLALVGRAQSEADGGPLPPSGEGTRRTHPAASGSAG
jgi:Flp pilus assembly protein TadD